MSKVTMDGTNNTNMLCFFTKADQLVVHFQLGDHLGIVGFISEFAVGEHFVLTEFSVM